MHSSWRFKEFTRSFHSEIEIIFSFNCDFFSFFNNTLSGNEQMRAISHHSIRLIWITSLHVLSKSQWSEICYFDLSFLAQLYLSTMKITIVNVKMKRWGFTINLYLTTADFHTRSVLIMILSEIQKNNARFYHSDIYIVVFILEKCFHVNDVYENVSAIINDMWKNQIAFLSIVNDYMIVWKNMDLNDHFNWMKIRINRTNWKRKSSFLTLSIDNMIKMRMWLIISNRGMIKFERSSWIRKFWNHLKPKSDCEI